MIATLNLESCRWADCDMEIRLHDDIQADVVHPSGFAKVLIE